MFPLEDPLPYQSQEISRNYENVTNEGEGPWHNLDSSHFQDQGADARLECHC